MNINQNSLLAYSKLNLTKGQMRVYEVVRGSEGMTMQRVADVLMVGKNTISGRFGELVKEGVLEVKSHTIENGSRVGVYTLKKKEEPDWDAMRLRAIEKQRATITNLGEHALF